MSEQKIVGERYELKQEIGVGGMGTVFLGLDTVTGDTVAIKQLKPDVIRSDPEIVERFDREGEMLRKLHHPGIVAVLATVEEDGNHYIVLEYVSGGSLRDMLDETPQMPYEQVLQIALDLSDALARAHRLEIIHRDIKPANVLVAEDGTPRLTDFGVARMGGTTRVTATGAVVGTLAYLPPESLGGEPPDERSDLWAFGVMLYEMLAGRRPFGGDNTGALLTAILSQPVPDMLEFLNEDIPWSLMGLVYWLLEKEPDKRPASARLVGAMIENIISGAELPMNWFDETQAYAPGETPLPEDTARMMREFSTGTLRPEDYLQDIEAKQEKQLEEDTQWHAEEPITRLDWSISSRREVEVAPRVHILYRREDSGDICGRIYDRMLMAFGEAYVVRDMQIPPGVDTLAAMHNAAILADVLLVIIGDNLLSALEKGKYLNDPDDHMRIALASGLKHESTLVIPALVHNARMPKSDVLADDIRGITRLNAAVIRNDPDFNRDIEWLINQIVNSFEIKRPARRRTLAGGGLVAVLVLIAAIVGFFVLGNAGNNPAEETPTSVAALATEDIPAATEAAPILTPTENTPPTIAPIEIAPVDPDKDMVLVAQFAKNDEISRDAGVLIARQLRESVEEDIPFSAIEIREYPQTIASDDEAIAVATEYGAQVILWGRDDGDIVEVEAQIGDLSNAARTFSEDLMRDSANVRLELADPRRETMAFAVHAILNVYASDRERSFQVARNLAVMAELNAEAARPVGNSVSARFHRYIISYIDTPEVSLTEIDAAIGLDAGNTFLYLARSILHLRLGNFANARDDMETAKALGTPDGTLADQNLMMDLFFIQDNIPASLALANEIIDDETDDWWLFTMRGMLNYLSEEYDAAKADIDTALALDPQANFAHAFATAIAMRQGDLVAAQDYVEEILRLFPDPGFSERLLSVSYNQDAADIAYIDFVQAFSNIPLRQWRTVIQLADSSLDAGLILPETYFMKGFASCNLEDYEASEAAYREAIALDPDFVLLHALLIEVSAYQDESYDIPLDVMVKPEALKLLPYLPALQSGEMNCENFFSLDLEALLETETDESSP